MLSALVLGLAAMASTKEDLPMEWTLEQARKSWTPMVRPVQHVGVPGYEFQTGVMWNGALVLGPLGFTELKVMQQEMNLLGNLPTHVSIGFGDPMEIVDRKGTGDRRIRRWLNEGRLPIPTVETQDGQLCWQETVFASLLGRKLSDGMKPKTTDKLVTHAVFRVKNSGYGSQTGHLWLHFGDVSKVRFGYKAAQDPELAPSLDLTYDQVYGKVGNQVRFVLPAPTSGKLIWHADSKLIEWQVSLKSKEEAELSLAIPYGLVDLATAQKITAIDPAQELGEVKTYWTKLLSGNGQIITPDPFINDYLVAVGGQMAQQVAFRHSTSLWMYKTSPNHYEGYWPCNAAKALPAFDYRGLTDINRNVLQGFVQSQTDDVGGLTREGMGQGKELEGEGYAKIPGFMGNFGEWTANPLLISHGVGMWALAQHYRITRDDKWLNAGALKTMIDAFDWVATQRKRTMREVDGKKVPYWGLLPAASAHDWLAGNTIFNDAYCIYGMTEVVRLLREIKHPRVKEMTAVLTDYRKCLHDRYAEATQRARKLPLADGSTIPFVPRMVQELDWTQPDWTYTGYSPVRAGAMGALDPNDELVNWSLAYLDAGMPKGEGPYFGPQVMKADTADKNFALISDTEAPRHFLWRHYVEYETMWPVASHLFLARDDLPRFFEWFTHNLTFVVHQDWRVGVESIDGVPSCAPGEGERWQAIRNMFVHERGGYDGSEQSLWLLQAIPREWLKPGSHLAVKDMGTAFGGKVNLKVDVAADGKSIKVEINLSKLAIKPAGIVVRLRTGDGRPIRTATLNGQKIPVDETGVVELPVQIDARWKIVGRP